MADHIKKFPEIGNLSPSEVDAVISFLVEFETRIDIVKEEFESLFDKKISADVIYRLKDKYATIIAQKTSAIQSRGPREIPIARRSMRLRLLNRLVKIAFKKEPRYSIKIDKDTYEMKEDIDKKLALNAIMAADKVMNDSKRLEMDELKLARFLSGAGMDGEGDEDAFDDDQEGEVNFESA